ncbi:MAG TPA: metal ABC transporter substrate-binding protein [Methylomirabilota bacterium]|nr:metal ABC transporter substrate-binding protein [Methylomirabilota bacterium]
MNEILLSGTRSSPQREAAARAIGCRARRPARTVRCILALPLLLLSPLPVQAAARLNVVATLPDFTSIAGAVGGDLVQATSLAKGSEDAHFVDPRPSFIRVLNQADVLIEGGADLETGWLPPLVASARNRRILPGQPGRVALASHVQLLEVPSAPVDRSQGDIHAAGNPHFWLDPVNGEKIAAHLADVFARLDPPNAARYQEGRKLFCDRLARKLAEWKRQMEPFRGTRVLTYHKAYEYFAARFELEIVGQIEPKPGLEPSPTHLNALIQRAREQGVKLVLVEPFRARKTAEHVARSIGAKMLILPEKAGGAENVKDYFGLFDYAVAQITGALR